VVVSDADPRLVDQLEAMGIFVLERHRHGPRKRVP